MEGGAPPSGRRVTVLSTVGPLPADQGCGELLNPRVSSEAEAAAGGQGVSLDGGAAASQPAYDRNAPARPGEPRKDVISSGDRARLARGDGQLYQGDQPPVRAGPLPVRIDPEPSTGLLAGSP